MKMLKCCLNWKVIAGLAVVGAGIFAVAPDLALAALPILLLAICPLSMMFMMKGMQGNGGEAAEKAAAQQSGVTREEQISRLRAQQSALTDRIADLEQEEPQTARNGKAG
jgi:hypothetical protein